MNMLQQIPVVSATHTNKFFLQ